MGTVITLLTAPFDFLGIAVSSVQLPELVNLSHANFTAADSLGSFIATALVTSFSIFAK
jgi:hypothetical protein